MEKTFCFWSLLCFQERNKARSFSEKFRKSSNWISPNMKDTNWIFFLIINFFRIIVVFCAVEAKNWNNYAKSFQVILQSISCSFCSCKKCIDIYCSSSSSLIHPSSNSNTGSVRLRRWLRVEKIWLNLLFTIVSTSRNLIFIALCSALLTHREHQKMAQPKLLDWNCIKRLSFLINLDKIDTDVGTCSPTQVVVSASHKWSFCIQIDSKSNIGMFSKSFRSSE